MQWRAGNRAMTAAGIATEWDSGSSTRLSVNFVTYGNDEKSLRPQVFLYAASFGGAALSSYWQPYKPNPVVKGYQGVATQTWVGVLINMVSEFTPDFKRAIHRNNKNNVPAPTKAP